MQANELTPAQLNKEVTLADEDGEVTGKLVAYTVRPNPNAAYDPEFEANYNLNIRTGLGHWSGLVNFNQWIEVVTVQP